MSKFPSLSFFLIVAFFFALSAATSVPSKNCKETEFWYEAKQCCLPYGAPPAPPEPPKGQQCPPTGYYWGERQGCCVPSQPPPKDQPPPQCRKGWDWYPYLHMCLPHPTPPSPPPSHPSGVPYNQGGYNGDGNNGQTYGNGNGHTRYRRGLHKSRSMPLCPGGLDACPISGLSSGDYECVDTATELAACGGCPSLGQGQDCTAIPGAFNVGCERGSCAVYSCALGFRKSQDGKSCIPL